MRRLVLLVYAFHVLVAADSVALVPLVPTFARSFHLSVVETGLLVAAPALSMVVLSLPVGLVSDRVGAGVTTTAACGLLSVSALGQAAASSYLLLLGSWTLFGVAYAVIYTAAPAWLASRTPPEQRTAVLGGVATVSGLGLMVGPAFAGLLSERLGTGAPFLVVSAVAACVAVGLAAHPSVRPARVAGVGSAASMRALLREPYAVSVFALMGFLGAVGGVVNLLVPLRLARSGFGAAPIGVAFTASMALFVLCSARLARLGDRVPLLRVAAAAALALGAVLLVPALVGTAVALLVFLALRAPIWSVLSTLSNPLSVRGSERAAVGAGAALAGMNLCWAIGNLAGPLAGGALSRVTGDGPVFALLAAAGIAVGAVVLRVAARRPLVGQVAEGVVD